MNDIIYKREPLAACFDELKPIIERHYLEIAEDQDVIALDPDWDRYAVLDEQGVILFITARDAGKLVGYYIGFITPHLHYKMAVFCATDIFFLEQEYRNGRVGLHLLAFTIDKARELGVIRMVISCKLEHDLRGLLVGLGFTEYERTFSMVLGE